MLDDGLRQRASSTADVQPVLSFRDGYPIQKLRGYAPTPAPHIRLIQVPGCPNIFVLRLLHGHLLQCVSDAVQREVEVPARIFAQVASNVVLGRRIRLDCLHAAAYHDGAKLGKGNVNCNIWVCIQHGHLSIMKMKAPILALMHYVAAD